MPYSLLLTALGEFVVAVHKVLDNAHHLNNEFPLLVLDLAGSLHLFGVLVKALYALFLCPCKCLLVLLLVIDAFSHSPYYLYLVNRLNSHSKVFLDELRAYDRAAYTHSDRAYLEV